MENIETVNPPIIGALPEERDAIDLTHGDSNLKSRKLKALVFRSVFFGVTMLVMLILFLLLGAVIYQGIPWLDFQFLTSFASRFPARAGVKAALFGSLWLMVLTAAIAVPIGVMAGIYLEELMKRGKFYRLIITNIRNLAGVPSIVYGILGLTLFVQSLGLGRSLLSGALTLTLLIFPIIFIATSEALQSVPDQLRQAALAIGATKWQTTRDHILPVAMPGILTGVILALSRAIGEAAPIIIVGAVSFIAFTPESPMDSYTALPIQIYNWVSRPKEEFHALAAAGIIVLLTVMLVINGIAIILRNRAQRKNLCQRL